MNFIHNVHNLAYNLILYAVILSSTIHPGPRSASAQNEDPVREEITAMILHDARPMQFLEEKTGKPSGFAVDCMNIIAQRAGFSVTYTFGHDFSGLTEELKRGDVDVLPMFAVSEERRKDVDFTEPLDSTLSMLFVRAKDQSITELRAALNVGVVQGSVIDIQLQNRKDFSLIKYTGFTDAFFDLLSAQIDGLAAPESTIWGMAIDAGVEDKISTAVQPLGEEISAMAVKKGNVRLLKKLINGLIIV
jgi:ABC-type amino acid transport substrate-binding protein